MDPEKTFAQEPENDSRYNFVIGCGNPDMAKKLRYPNSSYDLPNGVIEARLVLLVGRETNKGVLYLKTLLP